MKTRLLPVLTLFVGLSATAQTLPVLDQNPTQLRWYRVSTPHFRILYPDGFDSVAQRTARRLEGLHEPVSASLERRPRRISVLLQNQTTVSNGFVSLLPRRSEFFAVQPQNPGLAGTLDWLDLLAVHEYRHVVQNDKALQGYGRLLYTLFGNVGLNFPLLTVPDWFAEGDAVSTETLLTPGGRGRIPYFNLNLRANLLAGRRFGYPKAVCGSFIDNVANHYELGYYLTTYLKRTYGPDAWSRVLNRNYRHFPWPFTFSGSIRKETGLRVEQLYQKTMDDLTETWQKQQEGLQITPASGFPIQKPEWAGRQSAKSGPVFTNYQHPQYLTDSTVLCVKSGFGDTPRLVRLDKNGREKTVFVQGFPNDPGILSATPTKACWIEFGYDPRWGQRVYSNIRLLDLTTGQLTRLTHRTRYTAAALSPDAKKLVVVDNTDEYQIRLLVLDAANGAILKTLPNPGNELYIHPRWRDDRTVVAIALKDGQKTIELIDTETNARTDLLPRANENLSHPQPWGNYVLYNSPRSGIDNIYAVDTQTKAVFQVTSRPLAAYHAAVSPGGNRLAFEDFSATGYRIMDMPLNPTTWQPARTVDNRTVRYFGPLVQQEPGVAEARQVLNDSNATAGPYPASRFSRLANAINIYSWGPLLSSNGQALSVSLSSQDLLSTTQLSVGYNYNQAERVGAFFANLSYQGLYPILDVSFQRGNRNTALYVDRVIPADSLRSDRWQYNQLTAGFRIPLQLTNSKYIQSMSLSAYYNYLQVSGYELPFRYITEVGSAGSLSALTYGFSYSRLLRQSKRDVAPRWGQTLSVSLRNTPFGGRLTGEQWSVQGNLFFPGLGKHHSLRLRGGYQQQAQGTYRFSPTIFYPRGQIYVSDDKITAGSAEYRLPLADVHWSLGRWLYIQRIKTAGFFDTADGQSRLEVRDVFGRLRGYETVRRSYQSAGVDLTFVFNALRLRVPFELGVRTIYNVNTGQILPQLLVVDIGI